MISLSELLDIAHAATSAAEVFPSDPDFHRVILRSLEAIDAFYLSPMLSRFEKEVPT